MKRYLSTERIKVLSLRVGGALRTVRFHDMGAHRNCGVYVTNDASVAAAIEAHPDYGRYFYLESGTIESEVVPARVYDKVYEEVRRTQEANKVLVQEYGIDKEVLKSKEDALHAADKLNIGFPNL